MNCGNMDFDARWPWAACAKKPLRLEPKDYTGCECHDAPNESWFKAHGKELEATLGFRSVLPEKRSESRHRPAVTLGGIEL